jgi:hypothetical protein
LYRNYEDCLLEGDKSLSEQPKLEKFLALIGEHEKLITDKNLEFFDIEIEFLEEISFKNLWSKNISNKTRESIWKYLQTFQIININLRSSQQLKDALSQIGTDTQIEVDKSTAKDLKKLKKLSEGVKEEVKEESDFDQMIAPLMDSGIGDIAKEVAKTMDIEKMFGSVDENSNPMDIMSQMMNPEKMGAIFQNINSVMEQKMDSGELTKDSLKSEAEGMMGSLGENPMFKNLMQGMDPNVASQENHTVKEELTKEEKQKKLREKINEKKANR